MTHSLTLDAETRSPVDLGDVGHHIYSTHPKTEVRCVAYCVDEAPVKIWHPGDPVPKEFVTAAKNDDWVGVAHNAAFDHHILKNKLAPIHGFPIIPIERMVCTMALVNALALPGKLERVAKVLDLEHQKDVNGARVQMQMARPRRPRKGEDKSIIHYFDDVERHERSDQSCMMDVAATRELYQRLPGLSSEEHFTWLLDQRINDYGFYLDRGLAEAARKIAEAANPIINEELTNVTQGEVTAFTQVARLTKWLNQFIEVKSLNKTSIEELLNLELPENVRRAIELRLLGAQAAVAKVDALLQRRCDDGRVRGSFVYHAAGPGRWSSRGAQVHNLKRPLTDFSKDEGKELERAVRVIGSGDINLARKEYDNPLSIIGDCIRAMIISAPGHMLVGGDFSGIEARVTAWIAGEERKLDVFRAYDAGTGHDPYIIFAAEVFGVDPDKLAAGYAAKQPLAREQRQVGKAGELAFGFQGGVKAYRRFSPASTVSTVSESAHRKHHGLDRGLGVSLDTTNMFTDYEIEKIKNKWRRMHPNICRFWFNADRAAWKAVRNPGSIVSLGNNLQFECDASPFMTITLPSGRKISYPNARITRAFNFEGKIVEHERGRTVLLFKDNANGQWSDVNVYGGLLTENIVQGIARDLLRDAMHRVDAAGYNIVVHVHDECIIEAPTKQVEKIKPHFTALMKQASEWAEGLPIVVNSWVSNRYTK
jgi:DNA polymerase bacteriophage-type